MERLASRLSLDCIQAFDRAATTAATGDALTRDLDIRGGPAKTLPACVLRLL
jgi:hypothetical protein